MTVAIAGAREAMLEALRIRRDHGVPRDAPVNPIDFADRLGIETWFKDVGNLEGLYVSGNPPRIILPSDRPLGRQAFACAHELGHHVFGHGTRIDVLGEQTVVNTDNHAGEEQIAHLFATNFLMPRPVVEKGFSSRKWDIGRATSAQVYTVACSLGVSYEGLVIRLAHGFKAIDRDRVLTLRKTPLPRVRQQLVGHEYKHRVVPVDRCWPDIAIDLWVNDAILVSNDTNIEHPAILAFALKNSSNSVYSAKRPGISRIAFADRTVFVRVCRTRYKGLAQHRFWDDPDAD